MSNGAAAGHGIYLAPAAATSLGYALGGNKIFACRGMFRYFSTLFALNRG